MKIYIVRHGETEWNVKKLMQGWKDSPLTENGIRNAENLSKRLKNINFDYIFSSPSYRAQKTAEIIAGNRARITVEDDLKEMGFGSWEGAKKELLEKNYPEEIYNFWNKPDLYKPVDGETFDEIFVRVNRIIDKILGYNCDNILIVSHTVFIRVLFLIIKNIKLENLWTGPIIKDTGLTIIECINNKIDILLEADTSHY